MFESHTGLNIQHAKHGNNYILCIIYYFLNLLEELSCK